MIAGDGFHKDAVFFQGKQPFFPQHQPLPLYNVLQAHIPYTKTSSSSPWPSLLGKLYTASILPNATSSSLLPVLSAAVFQARKLQVTKGDWRRTRLTIWTYSDICKIILAIILPPLGVFLERGCNADFLINILLTILGYIPGIIHAL